MRIRNFTDFKLLFLDNQSIKQTIFKNTFWLMLAEGISKGLMFFLTILVARYLGAAGYGNFSFAFAFVSLFAVLADFGLSTLTIREVARDKSLARKYIDNIAVIKLILGLITFGLIIIVIQFLGKTPEAKTLVYLAGIWVIIQNFTQFFQSIFRAFEKMQYEALSKITYSILLFLIAGFVLWQNLGIKLLVQSYIYAALIVFIIALVLVRKKFTKFWTEIDFKFWKETIKKAFFFFLATTAFVIYFKIDTVMLSLMKSDEIVGWYTIAFNSIFSLGLLPDIVVNVLYPRMSKIPAHKTDIYKKSFILLFCLVFFVIFLLYIFRNFIVEFLYGIEYPRSTEVFLPLCIAFLLYSMAHLSYTWLLAHRMERKVTLIALMGLSVNVILNLLLIPKFSMNGAAYASLTTEGVVLLTLLKINLTSKN